MSEWKKVKFLDLFSEPTKNGIYKSKEFHGRGAKIINMGEVFAYSFIGNQEMSRVEINDKERNSFLVKNGDLLFARRSLVESGAGKCAIANGITEETTFESSIIRVRLNENNAIPLFYMYWMRSLSGRTAINGIVNGVNVKGIRATDLQNIEVELPPMEVQHRIATILSRYDSLIENYQKQIKLLEEAAQRLYKEWFVDLHFPGHESTKIVDGIPEGWEKKALGELFSYVRGKSYSSNEISDEGCIMVNLKNIQAFGGYKRDAEKRFIGEYKPEQTLQKGDLVMGVTDMTQERRLVGHVALIPDFNEPATFSMDLIKIIPYSVPIIYLYCAMRYGGISKRISPLANGVNVLHLKPDAMMGTMMVIPRKDLVERFCPFVEEMVNKILKNQSQIRLLTEARDRLLPKLMSGEIAV